MSERVWNLDGTALDGLTLSKPGTVVGKLAVEAYNGRTGLMTFRCACGEITEIHKSTLRARVARHGWEPGCEKCSPLKVREALFGSTGEAGQRLRAVLDAIDLTACEDRDGWIRLTTVEGRRAGLDGEERSEETAGRWWTRVLSRLREHGLDYETFAEVEGLGASRHGGERPKKWSMTAIRWTEDGEDRLIALVEALDKWLLSQDEAEA